jgi:hypothetical protein
VFEHRFRSFSAAPPPHRAKTGHVGDPGSRDRFPFPPQRAKSGRVGDPGFGGFFDFAPGKAGAPLGSVVAALRSE